MVELVLASSSVYRQEMFARLGLSFSCFSPDINEDINVKAHDQLVETLSLQKAQAAQAQFPKAVCIGADTIATLGEVQLGKPKTFEKAVAQLQSMSQKTVIFYSGVAMMGPPPNAPMVSHLKTEVTFKKLSDSLIKGYLLKEQPYNSCGSFQSETSAIALIESCQSSDPTAIIGLPLIKVCEMLEQFGITPLQSNTPK